jgi:Chaperone of endosialidase
MSGTLKATNIQDGASSTVNLALDSSGNVTVGNNLTVSGTGVLNIGSGQIYKDSSGNVGIGTTSPSNYGNTYIRNLTAFLGDQNITVGAYYQAGTGQYGFINSGNTNNGNAQPLVFQGGGTERMRIDSSGNLLLGTTSQLRSGDKFSVLGSGTQVATFQQSTNTSGYSAISTIIQSNGNNTSTYHFWGNTNGVGNWYLYGNGTTSYSSDQRLKKNIETTRDGYLEDLCKLRVVKYNWKNDADSTPQELGLIAQEVEQIFPRLVQDDTSKISETDNITYKQLKQSVLPFMLLKALQEAVAKIDALETRIATLEGKVK